MIIGFFVLLKPFRHFIFPFGLDVPGQDVPAVEKFLWSATLSASLLKVILSIRSQRQLLKD